METMMHDDDNNNNNTTMNVLLQQQQQHDVSHTNHNNNNNNTGNDNHNNNNNNTTTTTTGLLQNEMIVIRQAGKHAVRTFLQNYNCLSILKTSTKVVVFDIRIPIQLAFYALVEHDMLCAPLWDSQLCQFIGLFTVTDFIDLLYYYSQIIHKDFTTLAIDSISDVIQFLKVQSSPFSSLSSNVMDNNNNNMNTTSQIPSTYDTTNTTTTSSNDNSTKQQQPFMSILLPFQGAGTECTLYRACTQLLSSQQDFLPIVFTADMRVLSCITYTTILEHLVTHFREQRRLFDDSVMDLNIGTYGSNVISVLSHQSLGEALQLMAQHHLSALPVIDTNTQKIMAMYSRSDITFLTRAVDAEDAVRNLNLPLHEIINASISIPSNTNSGGGGDTSSSIHEQQQMLQQQQQMVTTPDALRTCSPTHTLQAIFESFAIQRFNRLCVIDHEERLLGIVSAKDLVAYFLQD